MIMIKIKMFKKDIIEILVMILTITIIILLLIISMIVIIIKFSCLDCQWASSRPQEEKTQVKIFRCRAHL